MQIRAPLCVSLSPSFSLVEPYGLVSGRKRMRERYCQKPRLRKSGGVGCGLPRKNAAAVLPSVCTHTRARLYCVCGAREKGKLRGGKREKTNGATRTKKGGRETKGCRYYTLAHGSSVFISCLWSKQVSGAGYPFFLREIFASPGRARWWSRVSTHALLRVCTKRGCGVFQRVAAPGAATMCVCRRKVKLRLELLK